LEERIFLNRKSEEAAYKETTIKLRKPPLKKRAFNDVSGQKTNDPLYATGDHKIIT